MDEIFQEAHGLRGTLDVVSIARNKPRRYGKNGELLIDYDETEYHRKHAGADATGLLHRTATSKEKGGTGDPNGTSEERKEAV